VVSIGQVEVHDVASSMLPGSLIFGNLEGGSLAKILKSPTQNNVGVGWLEVNS
jgi:hypothetical protein